MIVGLDTLLTALYVELTDRIIPVRGFARQGPGKPPDVTGAELVCLAVPQPGRSGTCSRGFCGKARTTPG